MDRNFPSPEQAEQTDCARVPKLVPGSTSTIERIAVVLGISSEAMVRSSVSFGDHAHRIAQNAEAMGIFGGITDSRVREQALAYLRWIADQSGLR